MVFFFSLLIITCLAIDLGMRYKHRFCLCILYCKSIWIQEYFISWLLKVFLFLFLLNLTLFWQCFLTISYANHAPGRHNISNLSILCMWIHNFSTGMQMGIFCHKEHNSPSNTLHLLKTDKTKLTYSDQVLQTLNWNTKFNYTVDACIDVMHDFAQFRFIKVPRT